MPSRRCCWTCWRVDPTEIDALNGALVREAERVGLTAPTNAFLTRLVHALEAKQSMLGLVYGTA